MKIKRRIIPKKYEQLIVGGGFLIIGGYLMFIKGDVRGQIPFLLGIGIILWRK